LQKGGLQDQEDLRGVLRDLLTGSGYTVFEAADGEAGVAKAKSFERPTAPLRTSPNSPGALALSPRTPLSSAAIALREAPDGAGWPIVQMRVGFSWGLRANTKTI
jgi:hypothetical protein